MIQKELKKKKKLIEVRWFTKDIIKPMILKNLKQYVLFGNEIRNKIIQQSILKILKVRQDHKFLLKKSLKKLC